MKYDRTPHVRLYKRKDAQFYRIGWEGRTVLWHLRLEADLLGRIEIPAGYELVDIASKIDVSEEVLRAALPKLFTENAVRWESLDGRETPRFAEASGVTSCEGGSFRIVDFVASETAKRSTWLRVFELRQKRKLLKKETQRFQSRPSVSKSRFVPKKITAEEAKERGLITRTRAAQILGVSLATLRRREGSIIKPLLTDLGEHVFEEDEVRKAALKAIPGADAPTNRGPREARSEQSGDPIWRERAARIVENMGDGQCYSTADMLVLGRRVGLKASVVEETLAAAEGVELRKVEGKWTR